MGLLADWPLAAQIVSYAQWASVFRFSFRRGFSEKLVLKENQFP